MSDAELTRDPSFITEAWILYGIGVVVLALRFTVRLKTVGLRGLQMDDLFAFIALLMYTYDAATIQVSYELGTNLEAAELELLRPLTLQEVEHFTLGSKLELTAWFSYTTLLWSLKGTMLFFFRRVTTGLWQARLVRWLTWACFGCYLVVLLTLTLGCFPIEKNWQVVPSPGIRCTFKIQNFIVTSVLNIVTDAAILCVPLPLLWALQVPWKKKLVVGLLICSGIFCIAATTVRAVLTLGRAPSVININRWGVRETIVGIVAVNVPILRPLFTAAFWTGQAPGASSLSSSASPPYPRGSRPGPRRDLAAAAAAAGGPYEMTNGSRGSLRRPTSRNSILGAAKPFGNDIYVETVYRIQSEAALEDAGTEGWDTGCKRSRADVCGASDAV